MDMLEHYWNLTDKGYGHYYLPFYRRLLMGRDIKRILEIGVYYGDSIRMWADIFPYAEVTGIDINLQDGAKTHPENVVLLEGDAYDMAQDNRLVAGFDFILDDGPHTPESQLAAVTHFSPLLAPDGVLAIEDIVAESTMPQLYDACPDRRLAYDVDFRNSGVPSSTHDDRIWVYDTFNARYFS